MLNRLYNDDILYKKAKQEMGYISALSNSIVEMKYHINNFLDNKLLHALEYACTCAEIQFERSWSVDFEVFVSAEKLKESDEWIPEDCKFLCEEAGLLDQYEEADEGIDDVMDQAAEILGVQIY